MAVDAGPGETNHRFVRGSVIRVEVERPAEADRRGERRHSGCGGPGPGRIRLELCFRAYLRALLDIEHTYRFVKSTLGWRRLHCVCPTRPDVGRGSSSPPTPSSD